MRECLRCKSEMKEDYGLKVESLMTGVAPIRLSKGQGILSEGKEKIKVAVCPNCGYVELYVEKEIKK